MLENAVSRHLVILTKCSDLSIRRILAWHVCLGICLVDDAQDVEFLILILESSTCS